MKPTRALLAFLIVLLVVPALADDADAREELELARQQAFRSGFTTIVESLNLGTFDLLVSSINREEFIDRIFGLRLISQTIQRDFRENMQTQFANLIKSCWVSNLALIAAARLFALICRSCNSAITNTN